MDKFKYPIQCRDKMALEQGLLNIETEVGINSVNPHFVPIPVRVMNALSWGRDEEFYSACNDTGFQPQDEEQREKYEKGRVMINWSYDPKENINLNTTSLIPKSKGNKRKTKVDYELFLAKHKEYDRRYGMNMSIFEDADDKRKILREAGYTGVYGEGKARIHLEDASDARIGRVYENVLTQARKKQAKKPGK